jgi:AcrR family transcriptional regulator
VFTRKQEGILAGTREGEPGLPRGKNRLPPEEVRSLQRERLLRSVIAAVARTGFAEATVADIVRGARVSRAAFYEHFADKEECFLAAATEGGRLLIDSVIAATRSVPAGASAEQVLRASIRAYLGFLVREPAFAQAFYIDMPAAGPRAAQWIRAGNRNFARANRAWHHRARAENPDWPAVPWEAYYALAGATAELIRGKVSLDQVGSVTDLEETLVALHLAVLACRPWPYDGARPDGRGGPGERGERDGQAELGRRPAQQLQPSS